MKKQYGFVYVTAKNQTEAQKIARALIQKKLIACANIFPSIVSCYEWKGQYTEEKETILMLKTRQDLFIKIKKTILQNHSYECPCIVFIPISKGSAPFLSWVDSKLLTNS